MSVGLLVLFLSVSLFMVGLSVPLILRRVPPNPWYGFRTPKTLSDPSIWYPANQCAGRWLAASGGSVGLAAIVAYLSPGLREYEGALVVSGSSVVFGTPIGPTRFIRRCNEGLGWE